jgi:GNAT superfamily N-acetyltransferase
MAWRSHCRRRAGIGRSFTSPISSPTIATTTTEDVLEVQFRLANIADAPQLARMNRQLIQDEGHRNPMTDAQLEERMTKWIGSGEYRAAIFESAGEICGYALYRREPEHVYLRQLFVARDRRRNGIGRAAFEWLTKNAWQGISRVRIDVLIENKTAQAFWRSVGFHDYCLTMEAEIKHGEH